MTEDFTTESIKQIFGLIVTAVAGYMFAAFKKASKTELETLEKRVDEKLRERQALVIEPLKAQLATLEARLSDCITTRELDAKFSALEKRLDDILAMMQGKH